MALPYDGATWQEAVATAGAAFGREDRAAALVDTLNWQEVTRIVGRALDRAEQAEAVVAAVEAGVADVRARHPEFAGSTAAIADGGRWAPSTSTTAPARKPAS